MWPLTDKNAGKLKCSWPNLRGYRLAYRRGYYADKSNTVQAAAAKPVADPAPDPLSPFMHAGLPGSGPNSFGCCGWNVALPCPGRVLL